MRELDRLNPIVNAHVALFLFHANRGEEPEGVKSLFSRLSMGTIVVTRQ